MGLCALGTGWVRQILVPPCNLTFLPRFDLLGLVGLIKLDLILLRVSSDMITM